MKRAENSLLLAGVLLALIQFAGCAQKPPAFNKVEILTPKGAQTIAQNQSVSMQASVLNDPNAGGVTYAFSSAPGFGTLNQTSSTSATYTAPNPVTTQTLVKIIVTSVDFPNQSATVAITVVPPPTITTTSLSTAMLNAAYSATVTATGGLLPLSWSITSGALPTGLSLAPSSSDNVQITGKATVAGTYAFTITVTDAAGFSSSEQFTLAVSSLAITTTSPLPPGTVGSVYDSPGLQFAATGGVAPYTWSVASGTSLPAGLTLDPTTGLLSGTPITAGSYSFGITVTDNEIPPVSVTVNFTLVVNGTQNLTGLNGSYAFEFSGYNSTGFVAFAGTFTANGSGGITAGEEDYNTISGPPITYTNLVGSYTLGTDGRGTFTFTGSTPAQPTPQFTYAFSIDAFGNGRFIEFDSSGTRGSGKMELQTVSTCVVGTTTTYAGSFAFGGAGFSAAASSGPIAFAGAFTAIPPIAPSTQGSLGQGEMDTNVPNQAQAFNPSVTGLYQSGPDTSHCTMGINSGNLGSQNFSIYPVSPSEAFLVETDPASNALTPYLVAGEMIQQAVPGGSFPTQNVLSGPIAGGLSGQFLNGGVYLPDVAVLQITPQGSGSIQFLVEDNQFGTVSNWTSPFTVSYTADSLGRVQPALANPFGPVLYLVSSSEAFCVGTLNGGPIFGHFESQTGSPYTALEMANTFVEGTSAPAVSADPDISGFLTLSNTSGVTGTQDVSTTSANTSAQTVTGSYVFTATGSTDGSGVMTYTSPVFTGDFFIVSPTKIVMITTTTGNANPVLLIIGH